MHATVDRLPSALARRRAMLVLLCVSAPSFMLQLDANIVAVSLPSISESLKANFAGIEWVVTAYTLCFASLLLPAGALADRFGRKRVLMIGLVLFTAASFFCGAAPDLTTLIAARAVQGAGAAMQLSAALATLSSFFKGDERARAFAFWGTVVGIGIAMGPIVGGAITQITSASSSVVLAQRNGSRTIRKLSPAFKTNFFFPIHNSSDPRIT